LYLTCLFSARMWHSVVVWSKGKIFRSLIKHHTMVLYGNGGIAPRILNLGAMWRWIGSFAHRVLYFRRKSPRTHCTGGCVHASSGVNLAARIRLCRPAFSLVFWLRMGLLGRSQWPRVLRHELSLLARTLKSWGSNPSECLDVCIVCVYSVFVLFCV
jgi:hypothetical protein